VCTNTIVGKQRSVREMEGAGRYSRVERGVGRYTGAESW
jgi:hypothetical protein